MCSARSSNSVEAAVPVTAASAATGPEVDPRGPRQAPGTFKVRFAPRREPGRSYVSAVQPLGLPPVVAGPERSAVPEAAEQRALQVVRDAFGRGPRSRYAAPVLSSHEYGWWVGEASGVKDTGGGARLYYPIREILRVQHHDTAAPTRRR